MDELLYVPGKGLLYRLDPRSKLLFAIGFTGYLAIESEAEILLLTLLLLHILCLLAKGTRARLLPLWRTLAPLLITIVVIGSLRWRAENALLALGPVTITFPALWTAVGLAARIAALSLVFSITLWTTEPGDTVASLRRLGVPFELSFPVIMVLQYVVTFRRQFYLILEAQQSRGLTFSRGNPIRMARAYIPVLVPLIITALRSADSLALALQSRGFGAGRQRTSRRVPRIGARDWIFCLATWGTLIGLSLV